VYNKDRKREIKKTNKQRSKERKRKMTKREEIEKKINGYERRIWEIKMSADFFTWRQKEDIKFYKGKIEELKKELENM
jgi:hypothetical protein